MNFLKALPSTKELSLILFITPNSLAFYLLRASIARTFGKISRSNNTLPMAVITLFKRL